MVFGRAAGIWEGGSSRGRFWRPLYGTQRETYVGCDEAEAGHCDGVGPEAEARREITTLYPFVTVILLPFFLKKVRKNKDH